MNRRWTCVLAVATSIAMLVAINFSRADEPDDKGPPGRPSAGPPADSPREAETKKFTGTVAQFNYTPRGERDGILLTSDGKLVQLNFPPRDAGKLADAVAIGDQITAEGQAEPTRADHAVCRLEKLTTAKGKEIAVAGPPQRRGEEAGSPGEREGREGPGRRPERAGAERAGAERAGPERAGPEQSVSDQAGPPRRERAAPKTETIKGVVKSLNHGARGEVDGVVLENGDFVRTGPREAEEAKLAVGQEISVEGYTMKMPDGNTMITFPVKINDKEVSRPRPFGRRAGPAQRQPPARRDAPPPDDK